jgi:hypothetical protein
VFGDTATGGMIIDECNRGSKTACVTSIIIHVPSFTCSPGVMGLSSIRTVASTQFGMPDLAPPHGKGTGLESIETRFKVAEICTNKTEPVAITQMSICNKKQ